MKKVSFYNKHSEKLVGVLHVPNKTPAPAIIISHGFGSSKANKEKWAAKLCDAGFLVLRFDFSGHGESAGAIAKTTPTKVADDLRSAIKFVKDSGAKKIGLTGHSLGGLASLLAGNEADAVAAIAPPSNFSDMYAGKRIDLGEWKKKGYAILFGIKVNYSLYSDAMQYDQKIIAESIKCPVLIVHGDEDEIVPVQHSAELFNALKCEKRLEILKGAKHNLEPEEYARMVELTKQWFLLRLF